MNAATGFPSPTPTDLVAVHLYGPLADRFGPLHHFAIRTPREAVLALDANYPDFKVAFCKFEHYCIVADDDVREGDGGAYLPVRHDVHIAPMIEGRGPLVGALIGAAFPILATTTFLGVSAATLIGTAIVLALSIGLSMLLAPKAKDKDDTKKDENYAFTGPENVTGQGVAVPLIYGRVFCGSVVVSAGLELSTEFAPTSTVVVGALRSRAGRATYPDPPPDITPPPGGWPPIIDGPDGPQPDGWVTATMLNVVDPMGAQKYVLIWAPDPQPVPDASITYAWNEVQGYYMLQRVQPTADEWLVPV